MNPTFTDKIVAFVHRYLPYLAVGVTVAYFGYQMRPQTSPAGDFDYRGFGKIPCIGEGRYKPLDTVARTHLMVITHRQAFYDAEAKKSYPATKWLLDVQTAASGGQAQEQRVFRVENDQLQKFLKLEHREGMRYSFREIVGDRRQAAALMAEIQRVRAMDPKKHELFDGKVYELSEHLNLFQRLAQGEAPLVVPSWGNDDQWLTFREALEQYDSGDLPDTVDASAFEVYQNLLLSYSAGDVATFNSTLTKYLNTLQAQGKLTKTNTEVFFNEFAPFYHCMVFYVIIAVLAGLSWLDTTWSQQLRQAAYATMGIALVVQLFGLGLRMYLQDRWFVFVTNLYSSAVFIGMGCVCVSMIAEWFYKNGIATVVGAATGFCTLFIAHNMLSHDGDTMTMMVAVLDTNFWLATHVTIVTLGYTMAFVAGFMGIAYIILGMFTDKLRKDGAANLTRMTYGVLCAGMFMSFVGTVLGGLWADYSWGRFWGWDPKENGALLIVIWIALILHARWGGMIKQRGLAVLSVLGIIITAWSWFGTNFLGVGLHAYGGSKATQMMAMVMIDFGFLAIAGLGCLPLEMWQSFKPVAPGPMPPTGEQPPSPPTGIIKMNPRMA